MSVFLFNVPYADKDKAKDVGARWSKIDSSWYAPNMQVKQEMAKHWVENKKQKMETLERKGWELDNKFSYHFDIPIEKGTYAEKVLGAIFDPKTMNWMAPNDLVWNQIIRYFPQKMEKSIGLELERMDKRKNYQDDEYETNDFNVPYMEKDFAKQLKAIFNQTTKCWSAPNQQIWYFMIAYWPQNGTNPKKEIKKEIKEEIKEDQEKISSQFLLDDEDFVLAKTLGAIYCKETNLWTAPNNEIWEQMCDKWEPI